MRHTPVHPNTRGVALLLVLGLLIVAVTAAATLARLSTTSRLAGAQGDRVRLADDLLEPAKDMIDLWLARQADSVVLPAEANAPRVLVADDEFTIDDQHIGVRITAWDQHGMLPIEFSRRGSPMRASVPSEMRSLLDKLRAPQSSYITGLDVVASDTVTNTMVYPSSDETDTPALGARIATHNPLPSQLFPGQRGRAALPLINVNTAPAPLLESALRAAGRGGLEAILQARSQGHPAPMPPSVETRTSAAEQATRLGFSGRSEVWSFRVDISIQQTTKSWWLMLARSATTPATRARPSAAWRMVQSHVIAD